MKYIEWTTIILHKSSNLKSDTWHSVQNGIITLTWKTLVKTAYITVNCHNQADFTKWVKILKL